MLCKMCSSSTISSSFSEICIFHPFINFIDNKSYLIKSSEWLAKPELPNASNVCLPLWLQLYLSWLLSVCVHLTTLKTLISYNGLKNVDKMFFKLLKRNWVLLFNLVYLCFNSAFSNGTWGLSNGFFSSTAQHLFF